MPTGTLAFQKYAMGRRVVDDKSHSSTQVSPATKARWSMHIADKTVSASLAARIAGDMLTLSPKLQLVAQYCLQHVRHLHLCRIQDIAERCGTPPSTVVRLGKRYGFRGFLDFKMAFLVDGDVAAPKPPEPPKLMHGTPQLRARRSKGAVIEHHALAVMDQCKRDMAQLESDWRGYAFCRAVNLLKGARTVWIYCAQEAIHVAKCYADLLRMAGLTVQWIRLQDGSHDPHRSQLHERDVLLTLSHTSDIDGEFDTVCMAKRIGVPVIAVTDGLDSFLARTADAHLCVANLGVGMHGVCAGIVLVHAVQDARLAAGN